MVFIIIGSILALGLILFLIVTLIIGRIVFNQTFRRRENDEHFAETEPRKAKSAPDRLWFFSNKIEEKEMMSYDGLKLKGYFIRNNSNKLVIFVHGYHGRYYSLTKQAQFFYENGYNILCINNRCHDTSEGKFFTMGKRESKDTKDWINLMIKENPDYEICLFGVSMGGHIVMMSILDLPINVKCAVSDCGYASLYSEMVFNITKTGIKLPKYASWAGNLYSIVFHHFSFRNDTKNTLPKVKIPMLFMHGNKDSYVPYENLKLNFDYCSSDVDKKMHTFTDCDHCEQIKIKGEEYKEIVNSFVNKYIK